MVICLLSFLCLVASVRTALCLLSCMVLLLNCLRVMFLPIHVLEAFVSPGLPSLFPRFRSTPMTRHWLCALMMPFAPVSLFTTRISVTPIPSSIFPSPKAFGSDLGPSVLTRQHILSFQGRALVINALALSRVWYVASLIHVPPLGPGELLRLVFSFFWKGKKDLVARTAVAQAPSVGGFSVVDVKLTVQSLLVQLTPLRWRCFLGPLLLAPVFSLRSISRYCWPGAPLMVLSLGRGRPW